MKTSLIQKTRLVAMSLFVSVAFLSFFSLVGVSHAQISSPTSSFGQTSGGGGKSSPSMSGPAAAYSGSGTSKSDANCGPIGTSPAGMSSGLYGCANGKKGGTGSSLNSLQSQLQATLDRIEKLRAQIAALSNGAQATTTPKPPRPEMSCVPLSKTLVFGDTDAKTNGEVSRLQHWLGSTAGYKGGVTGYFGPETRNAVKSFQKQNGIASGGDESSTGYGMVGGKTRGVFAEHMQRNCEKKEDVFTVSDITKIVVTVNLNGDEAAVAVDLSTSTDVTFEIASTTREKMVEAIGKKLDTSYRFKFGTTTKENGRYSALASKIEWKSNSVACTNSGGHRCARDYALIDVAKVESEQITKGTKNRATTTRYTVTRTDGTVRSFVKRDADTNPFSEAFTKVVRNSGYTGDIAALLAKAVVKVHTFKIADVASVVVDTTASAHDGPFKYKVTLKNGGVVKFEVCSFCLEPASDRAFRTAGYRGDVDDLKAIQVTGSVLGASTSKVDTVLETFNQQADALQTALEQVSS